MSYVQRPLEQLISHSESAWPLVESWIAIASRPVEALPRSETAGAELVSVQVTTRSPMGAVIYHSGGILVDYGWLRILGSGHRRLPRPFATWNFECGMLTSGARPPSVLIADDILGGFFALNGGRFAQAEPTVWYFAPDTLEWEDTELGYSDFIVWSFSPALDKFYETYRWADWQQDISQVPGGDVFSFVPPLAAEGPNLAQRFRRSVPIAEVFKFHVGTI